VKDLSELMKQAQAMQEKLQAGQERLAALEIEGQAGGGMVKLTLKGTG
jgi:DNA-binding protein YbaB